MLILVYLVNETGMMSSGCTATGGDGFEESTLKRTRGDAP